MIQTLIVDDENIERQGIKRLINSYALPFQVTLASSGKMALDFMQAIPVWTERNMKVTTKKTIFVPVFTRSI